MDHISLDQWKYHIVRHVFTDTADEGYIVARWAFFHGMHRMYFWNAAHSIEKYLKASLLLNDKSVIKSNHLDAKLFQRVWEYARDLAPDSLDCPKECKPSYPIPSKEPVKKFIERLAGDGSTDNRYATDSYEFEKTDIFKLDQLIFSLRRLVIYLNRKPREPIDGYGPDMCYRDILTTDKWFEHLCPSKVSKEKWGQTLHQIH